MEAGNTMKDISLFSPLPLGSITLPNRVIMAPLTRMRAGKGDVPTAQNALYYAQRATAGLIIAEGTAVSEQGKVTLAHPASTRKTRSPVGRL